MNSFPKKCVVEITCDLSQTDAYNFFIHEISKWWPTGYSWSQEHFDRFEIDLREGGKLSEYGPNDFRCDWGTVLSFTQGHNFCFLWQINMDRSPQPDPSKSSRVNVFFEPISLDKTQIILDHDQFHNHGTNWQEYQTMMQSEYGWPFIMNCFLEKLP